jgi:hypothetical protein
MIWFSPTQKVTVWSVTGKGKYTEVQFSSSRKGKEEGAEWKNSSWSFVRFVGKAHAKANTLQRKDRIILTQAGMTLEPYTDKEGNTAYPKTPAIVVFDFTVAEAPSGQRSQPTQEENFDDQDIPF